MELKYLLFFQLAVGQEFPGFPGQGGPDNPYNIRPGQCPELPNQSDFQVDRYTGVWETVTTDDEENIPFGSECVTATYAKIAPNKISVNNSTPILPGRVRLTFSTMYSTNKSPVLYKLVRFGLNPILGPPGISTWAWGSGLIVDESEPTELYVSFEMVNICTPQGCQSIDFPNSTVTPYENYRGKRFLLMSTNLFPIFSCRY